jgi:hypothetical protein
MDMHAYHHAKLQGLGLMKRVACRVLPPHVLEQMKFELHMFWVRLGARQTRRAFQGGKDLLVNVGAGDTGRKGWVNVDGFRGPGVNCVYDVRTDLPFPMPRCGVSSPNIWLNTSITPTKRRAFSPKAIGYSKMTVFCASSCRMLSAICGCTPPADGKG